MPARRRIIVVGSAPNPEIGPLQPPIGTAALDDFIDGCDLVVRVNSTKNYGTPGAGSRTDIVVMRNHGRNGRRNIKRRSCAREGPGRPREVVFTHAPERRPGDRDHSDSIIEGQRWRDLERSFLPGGILVDLETRLGSRAGRPGVMATAGLIAIEFALRMPRFAGWTCHIAGFQFTGIWEGHAFEAEQDLVAAYMRDGLLAPVEPGPAA